MARRITREEGILAGESCGTAMVAALEVAGKLTDEGRSDGVIVVILPDGGRSYLSKLYNDEWMREHGLLATTGSSVRVGEVIDAPLPLIDATLTLDEAFALLAGGAPAVIAVSNGEPTRVVTRSDLLEHIANRRRPASQPPRTNHSCQFQDQLL